MIAECVLSIAHQKITSTSVATALDGVKITWGRSDSISQPQAATASVRLLLPENPAGIPETFTIGRTLSVSARIQAWKQGTTHTFSPLEGIAIQGDFDPTRSAIRPSFTSPDGATVVFPPAALSLTPGAWDTIPTCVPGQVYTASAAFYAPQGCSISLHPVYFSAPNATPIIAPATAQDTESGFTGISTSFTPPDMYEGCWVGIAVRANPLGHTWKDRPIPWNSEYRSWQGINTLVLYALTLTPPAQSPILESEVFTGTITDTSLTWDEAASRPVLTVQAADLLADLSHRRVGDEPWTVHTLTQRVNAVINALNTPVKTLIDPTPASRILCFKDVDSASAASILTDAASSAGALLWAASHRTTGAYLRFEDPYTRAALARLVMKGGRAKVESNTTALPLSASMLTRGGVSIEKSNADAASVARVGWKEIGVDEKGQPTQTERTITLSDPDLIRVIGHREVSLSTDLITRGQAEEQASRLLRSHAPGSWTLPALTWDTNVKSGLVDRGVLAALLDSTRRMGANIRLTDLPPWFPAAPSLNAYLDGGTYTYTRGRWILTLTLTNNYSAAGSGLRWNQLPPDLSWNTTNTLTWAQTSSLSY